MVRECEKREVDLSSSSACVSPASISQTGLESGNWIERVQNREKKGNTTFVSFGAKLFLSSYVSYVHSSRVTISDQRGSVPRGNGIPGRNSKV